MLYSVFWGVLLKVASCCMLKWSFDSVSKIFFKLKIAVNYRRENPKSLHHATSLISWLAFTNPGWVQLKHCPKLSLPMQAHNAHWCCQNDTKKLSAGWRNSKERWLRGWKDIKRWKDIKGWKDIKRWRISFVSGSKINRRDPSRLARKSVTERRVNQNLLLQKLTDCDIWSSFLWLMISRISMYWSAC